jgi:hypothetical protein
MTLHEKENFPHEPLYIEKNNILDDVEHDDDHYSGHDKDLGTAHSVSQWDHLASIEVPFLPKGDYILLLAIPQAHWFHTKGTPTCLSMDFMMEFMPKDASVSEEEMFVKTDGPIQIMGVFPPSKDDLTLGRSLAINLRFDRHVEYRDMVHRTSDLARLCQL